MARFYSLIKTLYVLSVVCALAWVLRDVFTDPATRAQLRFSSGQAIFVLAWIVMAALLGWVWSRIVRVYLGITIPTSTWLPLQGAAWAGRYLPGKLGLLAGRLTLLPREGVSVRGLTFTVLVEQVTFIACGFVVAMLSSSPIRALLAVVSESLLQATWLDVARIALALLACVVVFPAFNLLAPRFRVHERAGLGAAAVILCAYLASHLVCGLGFYALVGSFAVLEPPTPLAMIALLAAANVAGILAIFAPAGIGVREAVLAAGLAPYLSVTDAVLVAVVARILSLIADAAFVVATGGVSMIQRVRADALHQKSGSLES